MDPHFSQYPRMGMFLAIFLPDFKLEKREFNKENADRLILYLVGVLDALFKAENLARRKNFQLAPGKTFFPDDILPALENVIAYLQTFNTQVLSMSKTERQTLVFILENIGDYLKNSRLQAEDKEKKNLFVDYKFWIENLFKLFDQKISGAVTASKRVTPKNLFGPQEALHDELIYGNATLNFSLFPFAVVQDGRVLFLSRLGENEAMFRDLGSGVEIGLDVGRGLAEDRRIPPGQFLLCRPGAARAAAGREAKAGFWANGARWSRPSATSS